MKLFLVLLCACVGSAYFNVAGSQEVEHVSPQDVIDEVNRSIDDVSCGIGALSAQANQAIKDDIVNRINAELSNLLAQYDLQCLLDILDFGFGGIFDINLEIPGFCEAAVGIIGNNQTTIDLLTNQNGQDATLLIQGLYEKIQKKEEIKKTIQDW